MAIRINRVYTRSGDGGKSRLAGGQEISKDSARLEAYGTIDELNAVLGLVARFHTERLPVQLRDLLVDDKRMLDDPVDEGGSESRAGGGRRRCSALITPSTYRQPLSEKK